MRLPNPARVIEILTPFPKRQVARRMPD